jgi:excisionase family DNA binding protein
MPISPDPSTRLQKSTPATPQLPELLRIGQVAKALGTTERHLRRLIAERRIPFVKVGHFVRFDPTDISQWHAAHRVEVIKHGSHRR